MKKIVQITLLVFVFGLAGFTTKSYAQNSFHAKVHQLSIDTYELDLAVGSMIDQTDIVEVHLLDENGYDIFIFSANIHARDNTYHLYYNNEYYTFEGGEVAIQIQDETLSAMQPFTVKVILAKNDLTPINSITALVEKF